VRVVTVEDELNEFGLPEREVVFDAEDSDFDEDFVAFAKRGFDFGSHDDDLVGPVEQNYVERDEAGFAVDAARAGVEVVRRAGEKLGGSGRPSDSVIADAEDALC